MIRSYGREQECHKLFKLPVLCSKGKHADNLDVENEKDQEYEEKLKHNARLSLFEFANAQPQDLK